MKCSCFYNLYLQISLFLQFPEEIADESQGHKMGDMIMKLNYGIIRKATLYEFPSVIFNKERIAENGVTRVSSFSVFKLVIFWMSIGPYLFSLTLPGRGIERNLSGLYSMVHKILLSFEFEYPHAC